jgi:hypothetical protein
LEDAEAPEKLSEAAKLMCAHFMVASRNVMSLLESL